MTCHSPRPAWLFPEGGSPEFRFPECEDPATFYRLMIPCGKCEGCRLDLARDTSVRVFHESMVNTPAWFVTLTYDPEHLPFLGGLCERDMALFLARVREHFRAKGWKLRYYYVGEYGGRTWRPHYHAVLAGIAFDDMRLHAKSRKGFDQWTSATLDRLWGKGFCTLSEVGPEVAEYCARYSMKALGADELKRQDADGKWHTLPAPFQRASQSLGREWLRRYWSDVFPHGYVILRGGRKVPPPRAYLKRFAEVDPEGYAAFRAATAEESIERIPDRTPERLASIGECLRGRLALSNRNGI